MRRWIIFWFFVYAVLFAVDGFSEVFELDSTQLQAITNRLDDLIKISLMSVGAVVCVIFTNRFRPL